MIQILIEIIIISDLFNQKNNQEEYHQININKEVDQIENNQEMIILLI